MIFVYSLVVPNFTRILEVLKVSFRNFLSYRWIRQIVYHVPSDDDDTVSRTDIYLVAWKIHQQYARVSVCFVWQASCFTERLFFPNSGLVLSDACK